MIDEAEEATEVEENMDETLVNKRTKGTTGNEEEEDEPTGEDEEMIIDSEQQDTIVGMNETENETDEDMKEQDRNSSSFTAGFNSKQFQPTDKASKEATQQ